MENAISFLPFKWLIYSAAWTMNKKNYKRIQEIVKNDIIIKWKLMCFAELQRKMTMKSLVVKLLSLQVFFFLSVLISFFTSFFSLFFLHPLSVSLFSSSTCLAVGSCFFLHNLVFFISHTRFSLFFFVLPEKCFNYPDLIRIVCVQFSAFSSCNRIKIKIMKC